MLEELLKLAGDAPSLVDCLIALSPNGRSIAIGHRNSYCLLDLTIKSGQANTFSGQSHGSISRHQLVSRVVCSQYPEQVLTSLAVGGDAFTALVVTGFSSGHLLLFEGRKGRLLWSQLVHPTALIEIAFLPFFSTAETDDEGRGVRLQLTFEGGVVAILTLSSAVVDNVVAAITGTSSSAPPRLNKWRLAQQHSIVCLFPHAPQSSTAFQRPRLPGQSSSLVSSHRGPTRDGSNSFIQLVAIGQKPLISVTIVDEPSRNSTDGGGGSGSGGGLANYVGHAMVSLAKSIIQPTSVSDTTTLSSATTFAETSTTIVPPQHLHPLFSFNDEEHRTMLRIVSSGTAIGSMLAISDSLARIWLFDTAEGEFIRVWKGIRDAQMAFIRVSGSSQEDKHSPPLLALAIYHTSRGLIEYYLLRRGPRIFWEKTVKDGRLIQFGSANRAILLNTLDGAIKELMVPNISGKGSSIKSNSQTQSNLIGDLKALAYQLTSAPNDEKNIFNQFAVAFMDNRVALEVKADILASLSSSEGLSVSQHLQLTESALQSVDKSLTACFQRPELLAELLSRNHISQNPSKHIISELIVRHYLLSELSEFMSDDDDEDSCMAGVQSTEHSVTSKLSEEDVEEDSNDSNTGKYQQAFEKQPIHHGFITLQDILTLLATHRRQKNKPPAPSTVHLSGNQITIRQFLSRFRPSSALVGQFDLSSTDDTEQDLLLALVLFGWPDYLNGKCYDEKMIVAKFERRLNALKRFPLNGAGFMHLLLASLPAIAYAESDFGNPLHCYYLMKLVGLSVAKCTSTSVNIPAVFSRLLRWCGETGDLLAGLSTALIINPIACRRLTLTKAQRSEWAEMVCKSADALILSASNVTVLTANSLNSLESLGTHRLLALISVLNEKAIDETLNWFKGRYNPDIYRFYRVLEQLKTWTGSDINHDQVIRQFSELHPTFAIPAGLLIWRKYLEPIVRTVYLLIDRVRKAPRDKMLARSLETIGIQSCIALQTSEGIIQFLMTTKQFIRHFIELYRQLSSPLEEFTKIMVDCLSVNCLTTDKWFDYFCRDINRLFPTMKVVNLKLMGEYQAICLELILIIKGQLKSVRPSQLTAPNIRIFEDLSADDNVDTVIDRNQNAVVESSRIDFIRNSFLSLLTVNDEGLLALDGVSERITLNKNWLLELVDCWQLITLQRCVYEAMVVVLGRLYIISPSDSLLTSPEGKPFTGHLNELIELVETNFTDVAQSEVAILLMDLVVFPWLSHHFVSEKAVEAFASQWKVSCDWGMVDSKEWIGASELPMAESKNRSSQLLSVLGNWKSKEGDNLYLHLASFINNK